MNVEINNNKVVFFIIKTANYINNNNKIIFISITFFFDILCLIGIMEQSLSSFVTHSLYNKLLKNNDLSKLQKQQAELNMPHA